MYFTHEGTTSCNTELHAWDDTGNHHTLMLYALIAPYSMQFTMYIKPLPSHNQPFSSHLSGDVPIGNLWKAAIHSGVPETVDPRALEMYVRELG